MDNLLVGDCLKTLKTLKDNSVDSVVTDPPYEIGFMGKSWDGTGIAYNVELWRECLRVLKPGGHLLAFGATRSYHRMAVAIEDAGFEIRDSIHWTYGCLSQDSEILTDRGWVKGVDVQEGDLVCQWDSNTGSITITPVLEKYLAPYNGKLVKLQNTDTDQLLTPNHRVYHKTNDHRSKNSKAFRQWSGWKVDTADTLTNSQQIKLPMAGTHSGEGIGGTDYAALLGWVWTEGSFDKPTSTGVRIYQSNVKQAYCDEIAALMDRVGTHKRYDRDRQHTRRNGEKYTYTESTWFFSGELAQRVRADLPDKSPTYELLFRMTQDEKLAFLDAALKGDGSQRPGGSWAFEQKKHADREWFVTLLSLVGLKGTDYRRKSRDGGSVSIQNNDVTNVSYVSKMHYGVSEDYTGLVWCVRVPTGAFVARRNGKIFITGNSGFPKSHSVGKAIAKIPDTTAAAKQWEGWGTALKPSHEPVVVARKPLTSTVAGNVLEFGTGALNINASRVGADGGASREGVEIVHGANGNDVLGSGLDLADAAPKVAGLGRWPSNTVLTHAVDCVQVGIATESIDVPQPSLHLKANKSGHALGAGTGRDDSRYTVSTTVNTYQCTPGCPVPVLDAQADQGASRFFKHTEWTAQDFPPSVNAAPVGRWPSNTVFTHAADCVQVGIQTDDITLHGEGQDKTFQGNFKGGHDKSPKSAISPMFKCVPGCPVPVLDGQSGQSKSRVAEMGRGYDDSNVYYPGDPDFTSKRGHSDAGGASRFFKHTEWTAQDFPPFVYIPKPSKRERNAGCDGLPVTGKVFNGQNITPAGKADGSVEDKFSTAPAANNHPTVKPVKLLEYLITLVTPPGGTVLDPFLGSGTTAVAATNLGFKWIGCELTTEYIPIIKARVTHAQKLRAAELAAEKKAEDETLF